MWLHSRLLACFSRAFKLLFAARPVCIAADAPDFLLVGLANPGHRYRGTRHNVGEAAVEAIAAQMGCTLAQKGSVSARLAIGKLGQVRIAVAVPNTYMNLSGGAVGALTQQFGLSTENVIVVHDDLDLPPGKVKVKLAGSSGGHNGLKSCGSVIGDGFWRMRIGIGRPPRGGDVADYVLDRISPEDLEMMQLPKLAGLASLLFDEQGALTTSSASTFMNAFLRAPKRSCHSPRGARSGST